MDNPNQGHAYRGWRIDFYPAEPATGQWVAERHGVTIRAESRETLRAMLDLRDQDKKGRE